MLKAASLVILIVAQLLLGMARASEQPDPLDLLMKMQAAARELDYAGIYTYQQGMTMGSSRVVHLVDGTGERERVETLEGAAREYIRHNDVVRSLIPERQVIVVEHRQGERFPSLFFSNERATVPYYEMAIMPNSQRVAGRECIPVHLVPKDAYRYGYRLCIDEHSHLLLRVQTVSSHNEIVDQIAFTSVVIGEESANENIESNWDTSQWKVVEVSLEPIDLAQAGWRIPKPVGFDIITQVSRPLRVHERVSQVVLSDGLAAISVFVEPYNPAHHSTSDQGGVHKGALSVFRKRIGDYWLTALGQVPGDTLRDIAEHVEYVPLAH